jgi:hypothetical protein
MKKQLSVGDDALYFSGSNIIPVTIKTVGDIGVSATGREVYYGLDFYGDTASFFATTGEGAEIAAEITKRISILEIYRDMFGKL